MSSLNTSSLLKDNTKITPKEIVFKYLIFLPLFVITLTLSISISYVYLRYKVPMYNSTLSLLIKDDSKGGGNADAILDNLGVYKKKANLANEVEILKSASLMQRVVDSLHLNLQYFKTGQVKRSEMYESYPFIYESLALSDSAQPYTLVINFDKNYDFQIAGDQKWFKSGELIQYNNIRFKIDIIAPKEIKPEYKYYIQWRPMMSVAQELAGSLTIRQLSRDASILTLGIATEVPKKGRDILSQLVHQYNKNSIEDKNKIVDNTLRFVDERLYLLTNELGKVEQGLQSYKEKNEIIDAQMQGGVKYNQIQTTENNLNDQAVKLQVIKMIRGYINSSPNKFNPVPSSLGINDETLSSLINKYNEAVIDRDQKLKVMPRANPIVQVIENQIEKVRLSIDENLKNIQSSSQAVKNTTAAEYRNLKDYVRTIPSQERQLLEITRQQGIKQNLYLYLLQKREESAITRASAIASSYAIDPPITSGLPISPDKSGIYRMALLIGLLIPIAIIYIRELLNDKIVTRNDIIKGSSVPVIGEIAHHLEKNRDWVIGGQDRSVLAEQFRIVRTNLQYLITNKENPVILVTSSIAGEGKTFNSMNIGAVWSVANKKTVILEFDLRKPKITTALKLQNPKGITNFMLGQVNLEDLPVKIEGFENLYIVPAGPIPPNPSELLMDKKIDLLFAFLKKNFDLIVIDSAPVGLVSDTKLLSKFADATLYIIRQRYTLKKQLNLVEDLYNEKVLPSMGLIVNDVKMGGLSSYYGYGYGYGYSNSYNYRYGQEEKTGWIRKLRNYYR